jgi:hypothetical protein
MENAGPKIDQLLGMGVNGSASSATVYEWISSNAPTPRLVGQQSWHHWANENHNIDFEHARMIGEKMAKYMRDVNEPDQMHCYWEYYGRGIHFGYKTINNARLSDSEWDQAATMASEMLTDRLANGWGYWYVRWTINRLSDGASNAVMGIELQINNNWPKDIAYWGGYDGQRNVDVP